MEIDFYTEAVTINSATHLCSRKVKEGIVYIPYTEPIDFKIGQSIFITAGPQTLELKIIDAARYPSQGIGTRHSKILELHTKNLTSAPHEEKRHTNMISIGTLNGQQIQVGDNNTQTVNITLEQLAQALSKSTDPEAKGILKKLLENPTVSSVIGAGVSGLISLL